MIRIPISSPRPSCAGFDLDAIIVELDDGVLDVRLRLGQGLGIYAAVPAARGDRLRLWLVDGAAFHVDEPVLEADPFVFDLPRTTWQGELGALEDGSVVLAVVLAASAQPAGYRCEVTRRTVDGARVVDVLAWQAPKAARAPQAPDTASAPEATRPVPHAAEAGTAALVDALVDAYHRWDDPDRIAARAAREADHDARAAQLGAQRQAELIARLALPVAMRDALTEEVPRVVAWDRRGRAVAVYAVAPAHPAELVANAPIAAEARDDLEELAELVGAAIGATVADSRVVWVIDAQACAIWQEGAPCLLRRAGRVLHLRDRDLACADVRGVVAYAEPARPAHRGLALELAGDVLVPLVETSASDADWPAHLGRDLAQALGVAWQPEPRAGLALATPPARDDVPPTSAHAGAPALLAACLAAPDDDDRRLAWAAAVGGERGELVELQCALARDDATPDARRRVRALLDRHGAAWSGLTGIASAVRFERGFVDAAAIPADVWLARGDEIRAAAPLLTALHPTNLTGYGEGGRAEVLARVDRLLAEPALRDLAALDLRGVAVEIDDDDDTYWATLASEVAARLIATGLIPGLRGLALGDVEPAQLRALGGCDLRRLEVLELDCDRARTADWLAFLTGELSVRALHLGVGNGSHVALPALLDALPATLVDLTIPRLTARDLAALAAHPLAQQLVRLCSRDGTLGNTHLLAAFPRLRTLELAGACGSLPSELTATTMPALRELAHFSLTTLASVAGVIERFGAQLELLDLRRLDPYQTLGSRAGLATRIDAWAAGLAGIVLRDGAAVAPRLLHLGRERRAAYWDHVHLA